LVQSVNRGTWYARSAEVISSPWMQWTVWFRIPGDIIFTVGAVMLVYCVGKAVVAIFQQPTQAQPDKGVVVTTST
jgi:nitric oxide reductase subunit B